MYPQTWWPKGVINTSALSQFLWVRNWKRRGKVVLIWGLSGRLSCSSQWGCVIWRLDGLGQSASKVAHSHEWQVGTECWHNPLFPPQMDLSAGLLESPHNKTLGFPWGDSSYNTRRRPQCLLWPGLKSHTPSCLHSGETPLASQVSSGSQRGESSRRWGSLGGHFGGWL